MVADTDKLRKRSLYSLQPLVLIFLIASLIQVRLSSIVDDPKPKREHQLTPPNISNLDTTYSSSYDSSYVSRNQEILKPSWHKVTECKSDLNCLNTNSICVNGNCVRICTFKELNNDPTNFDECVYFHCDSKRIINFRPKISTNSSSDEFSIKTNNYPHLNRYLSRTKCAWILNQAEASSASFNVKSEHRFTQLNFDRFVTQFGNDYLYIFAGDSIYSPLVAALSGNQAASDEPSLTADQEITNDIEKINEENDEDGESTSNESTAPLNDTSNKLTRINITLFNLNTVYLLFKTDVSSSFSILNNFKSTRFSNKPAGVSLNYKFSSSCYNEILCYNEAIQSKLHAPNCSSKTNSLDEKKCEESKRSQKLVETVHFSDAESDPLDSVRSSLRRAFHCSFEYKGFMYAVGGFSFSSTPISFVSRLSLNETTPAWEHLIDRKPSTIVNRSNRRFFGEPDFKNIKLELPRPRYAHSCVLNKDDDHFYMYGGVIYDTSETRYAQNSYKQTTNELWSYNLITNKWTLLNTASNETSESQNPNVDKNKNESDNKNYILPIGVSGHSMYLVERGVYGKSLLIFFGYSEYYASNVNLIQEYVFGTQMWLLHNTPPLNIGFAHTSALDMTTNLIYFHGGLVIKDNDYLSGKSSPSVFDYAEQFNLADAASILIGGIGSTHLYTQSISSSMYAFDLSTFEWKKLPRSTHSCYAHSLTFVAPNKLVFYGGICDLNRFSYASTVHVSNQIRVYDTSRQEWSNTFSLSNSEADNNITSSHFSIKLERRQRYGHASFVFNKHLYFFAGFNGFFLRDFFRIEIDRMGFASSEISNDENSLYENDASRRLFRDISADNRTYAETLLSKTNKNRIRGELFQHHSQRVLSQDSEKMSNKPQALSCSRFTSCLSCHLDPNCIWHESKCDEYNASSVVGPRPVYKKPQCTQTCSEHKSCENCTSLFNLNGQYQSECVWCASQSRCVFKKAFHVHFLFGECLYLTNDRTKCHASADNPSENAKIPEPHVLNSPFLMPNKPNEVKQQDESLKLTEEIRSFCVSQYSNCSSCVRDERCGWCSADRTYNQLQYSLNSGLGTCLEGGLSGPIESMSCSQNWFYDQCPPCECNGHSKCFPEVSNLSSDPSGMVTQSILSNMISASVLSPSVPKCIQPCSNNTMGEYCEICAQGFFGHAENGGTCSMCECGQQAKLCDSKRGSCFCHTKGVVGAKCDLCDTPRYSGRPDLPDGTCFYNLTTDYQFTFNLNKDSDRHYTRINFVNHIAHGMDEDIDFMVRCFRETAYINVTYISEYSFVNSDEAANDALDENERTMHHATPAASINDVDWPFDIIENLSYLWTNLNAVDPNARRMAIPSLAKKHVVAAGPNRRDYYFGPIASQNVLLTKINCTSTELKYVFYNRDLNYADKNRNFLFVVYVYDFESPVTIQVAFSRRTRVQLLHFFITFFGCLLSLLIIAFITWKARQCYVDHRAERQRIASQERMSNRPFIRLFIDVTSSEEKEKLMVKKTNAQNKGKLLRTESTKSSTLSESGRKFLNSIKSSLKFGSSSSSKPRLGGNFRQNSCASSVVDSEETDIRQRPINSIQIEEIDRKFKIMPVAVEPLISNKSGIVTCILKLPQGDLKATPKGSTPFVLGSAFVQISSNSSLANYYNLEGNDVSSSNSTSYSSRQKPNEV